ncbi:SAM-dependent methyltransferase [Spongiactinospora rosea]|uniref:SAM-dependent methyltransferase n=1 Tax=Spongiactinospora rosea TaxID=2248750 RepID=A0A366LSR0_9ACTN|nr:SAM-dependent methyltransferase [Spongiactinospora rosea]RBQ16958.1 SAM-dependent methyltransferase [Spongiactinospora rosea]
MEESTTPPQPAEATSIRFNPYALNAARVYDYLGDGIDVFPGGREVGAWLGIAPGLRAAMRANRDFLIRVVDDLGRRGHDQFVDFEGGLPVRRKLHQTARAVNPEARVAYVNNDRRVVVRGRELLESPAVAVVSGDVRRPDAAFNHPVLTRLIDARRPVVVIAGAVLHFVTDEQAAGFVRRLRARLAPGSKIVLSHACSDDAMACPGAATPLALRSEKEIAALLEGCELEEPGLVEASRWPEPGPAEDGATAMFVGGVADLNAYGFPGKC